MYKQDEKSNAQSWELEITCKNKKYLDGVVSIILSYGMIDFDVKSVESHSGDDGWDGRYLVVMYCSWFHNLANITNDLAELEKKLDNLIN